MAFLFLAGVTTAYWAEARGNPLLTTAGADQTVTRASRPAATWKARKPLRHRQHAALRHRDDRRQLRRDQQLARLVHAARRPGAARQHHARRSDLRRRRRRDVRHAGLHHPVGVHRRPDGRPHAGIPRQEDPGLRRADGDARRAGLPADDPGVRPASPSSRPASARSSILNPGPHGLSEILYAFTSATGNNGSAFGGLNANTHWYNVTIGVAMLVGRFFMIIPMLAIAGTSAARSASRRRPARSR